MTVPLTAKYEKHRQNSPSAISGSISVLGSDENTFVSKENKNNDIYSTMCLLSVSLCQRSAILESIRWTQSADAILCHQ